MAKVRRMRDAVFILAAGVEALPVQNLTLLQPQASARRPFRVTKFTSCTRAKVNDYLYRCGALSITKCIDAGQPVPGAVEEVDVTCCPMTNNTKYLICCRDSDIVTEVRTFCAMTQIYIPSHSCSVWACKRLPT